MFGRRVQMVLVLLLGCGSKGEPVDGMSGTGSSSGVATTSATGGTGGDPPGTTEDTTAETGSADDYVAQCMKQTDRESCEAVPAEPSDPDGNFGRFCHWVQWVPVDPATCDFGEELLLGNPCSAPGEYCSRDQNGEILGPAGCECICDPAFPG